MTMVQDSGGVPLSVKGVVIGLNSKTMDVVWDVPFMSGVTLGDRWESLIPSALRDINSALQLLAVSWIDCRVQHLPESD